MPQGRRAEWGGIEAIFRDSEGNTFVLAREAR